MGRPPYAYSFRPPEKGLFPRVHPGVWLTPVGLLPIAMAGFDIRKLLQGAKDMQKFVAENTTYDQNPVLQYATIRNILYQKGLKVELLTSFEPQLFYFIYKAITI